MSECWKTGLKMLLWNSRASRHVSIFYSCCRRPIKLQESFNFFSKNWDSESLLLSSLGTVLYQCKWMQQWPKKNLLHWLPVIGGISFTARETTSSLTGNWVCDGAFQRVRSCMFPQFAISFGLWMTIDFSVQHWELSWVSCMQRLHCIDSYVQSN